MLKLIKRKIILLPAGCALGVGKMDTAGARFRTSKSISKAKLAAISGGCRVLGLVGSSVTMHFSMSSKPLVNFHLKTIQLSPPPLPKITTILELRLNTAVHYFNSTRN